MVNGFDLIVTMSNNIFEQTSIRTMTFFRCLMAFLSKHASNKTMSFLSSCNFYCQN